MTISKITGGVAFLSGGGDLATGVMNPTVTAGNLITILGVSWNASGNSSIAVTDTLSTPYTVLLGAGTPNGGGVGKEFIAYGIVPSSGACTVTVDPNGTGNYINAIASEWTSDVTTITLDVNGGESTGTSTAPSDGLTTLTAGALVLGVMAGASVVSTIAEGSGYTLLAEDESPDRNNYSAEYKIAGAPGAQTVDWALSGSQGWSVLTAAFKDTAGGASVVPVIMNQYRQRR